MIKVISPTVRRVGTILIHVRVIRRWTIIAAVPPHLRNRVLAKGVVKHLVHDHRNAAAVATVYKLSEFIRRAVVFVQCHVKGRVISPARIALKFRIRHQFYGIHTQTLNIIQRINQRLVIARGNEVTNEQFINQ